MGGHRNLRGETSVGLVFLLKGFIIGISFAAIFAGLGLVDQGMYYSRAILMVIGVFMGSGL